MDARLVAPHQRNNRETAEGWEPFAEHRARVTSLLLPGARRVAVLGAGNCNDVDLETLAMAYREIHLADLDETALARARERQPRPVQRRLKLHAPVDLGAALSRLPAWRRNGPTPAQLRALPEATAAGVCDAMELRFDTVLSACLLSQMMWTVADGLGRDHPALREVASALVVGHLRALVHMCQPGGRIVLVTDVASAEGYPIEELFDPAAPWELVRRVVAENACFAGTSPFMLERTLRDDPSIACLIEPIERVDPWLWRLSPDRTSLVCGLVVRRRPDWA